MKIPQRGRRLVSPLALGLALGLALVFAPAVIPASPAAAADCAAQWGSLVKTRDHHSTKQIVDVRSGQHACFDRLVIDVNGDGAGSAGYYVKYVKKVVHDGSGTKVRLRGAAQIQIVLHASAYTAEGDATYLPAHRRNVVDVSGYDAFRQVAWAGTFEGQTTIGLGVRARLPMRVLVINDAGGARRIVVDVAHSWE
jgi:hypothetical protein